MKKYYAVTGIALAVGMLCTTQLAGATQAADPSVGSLDSSNVVTEFSAQGNVEQITFKSAIKSAPMSSARSAQTSAIIPGLKNLFVSAPG
ncbi:hypothetical protein CRN61_01440, partial [Vibrio vulnificus]